MKAERKQIRAAHWKRPTTIAAEKFDAIAGAILQVLGPNGMRWGALVERVREMLPTFPGSVPHYTILCLRELETQGKVQRELGPPVLYSTATRAPADRARERR